LRRGLSEREKSKQRPATAEVVNPITKAPDARVMWSGERGSLAFAGGRHATRPVAVGSDRESRQEPGWLGVGPGGGSEIRC
jgi:hypothetical protein